MRLQGLSLSASCLSSPDFNYNIKPSPLPNSPEFSSLGVTPMADASPLKSSLFLCTIGQQARVLPTHTNSFHPPGFPDPDFQPQEFPVTRMYYCRVLTELPGSLLKSSKL